MNNGTSICVNMEANDMLLTIAKPFDPDNNTVSLKRERLQPTTADEVELGRKLVAARKTICRPIPRLHRRNWNKKSPYMHRYFCACSRFKLPYCCRHYGNVVLDRDILSKDEHICMLARPRDRVQDNAPSTPHLYRKRVVLPGCTARIAQLARPDPRRAKYNLKRYRHVLNKEKRKLLRTYSRKKKRSYTSISNAIDLIMEKRRLEMCSRLKEQRRLKKFKELIAKGQRMKMEKIICVIFEQMRDFMTTDHILVDKNSALYCNVLQEIKSFIDKEFHVTANIAIFQETLANNVCVWINHFIKEMNLLHDEPPEPKKYTTDFLPVDDYLSEFTDEECDEEGNITTI